MRLIDADALENEIVKTQRYVPKDAVLDVACMVNRAPTIEAKPVVYAHWEAVMAPPVPWAPEECYEAKAYKCSNCKKTLDCETPYCAFCGAQMDEEGIKIPVLRMEDVPKIIEEMDK